MSTVAALIVASGRGLRFGGDRPKQFQPLRGQPLLRRTMACFVHHPLVEGVKAVIHPDDQTEYQDAASGLELTAPAFGGATRQDSVRHGLESMIENPPDCVLIHDGARPLADPALITRVVVGLEHAAAVIPILPVSDTLKRGIEGRVVDTVDRTGLFRAQTPQGFAFEPILAAHRAMAGAALTDDAALASAAGIEVAMVAGDERNLKVTDLADLDRAERLMGPPRYRTGQGFDVHRLIPGPGMILMGLEIPCGMRLVGHSDADVGLHALTDALLGAIGAGDIGSHFPPTDDRWKSSDSAAFLRYARDLVIETGGWIEHVDVTLICELPKVGPHRAAMVARVAELLDIAERQVSVKATTTEGLGFTGRGEGIAAQAVATVGQIA